MGLAGYIRGGRSGVRASRRNRGKTAFVFAGGGVLGAIQVGHLEALFDAGIFPDLLVGASVGGLNAAAVAADPTPAGVERLKEIWSGLRSEDIFPGSSLRRAWHYVRADHLYPNTGVRALIERLGVKNFEELNVPLSVVAANLRTGAERWFDTGPIAPALLASTALPGIFPPVPIDGEPYVDGGVVNNVPISRAVELGATRIYILSCGAIRSGDRPMRRPLDVLMTAVVHSRSVRFEQDLTRYAANAEIHSLPTFDAGVKRFSDPTRSAALIEQARMRAAEYLAARPAAASL